jgi:hypothetical protein
MAPRTVGCWLALALAPTPGACTSSSAAPAMPEAGASDASVSCPESEPPAPSPCALAAGTECTYGDRCAPSVFACNGSAWQDVTPATKPPPPCPPALPANGDTCAACATTYRCDYDVDCAADGGVEVGTATCAGGHWLVGAVDCSD